MAYCDNLNVIGTNKDAVDKVLSDVVSGLSATGLVVHEIEAAAPQTTSLGFVLDGDAWKVRPKGKKLAQMRAAILYLEGRPRISGRSVERLGGI